MGKTIKINCFICNKEFERSISEYNRQQIKRKSKPCCSRVCTHKLINIHLKPNLGTLRVKVSNELSPFRVFLRRSKKHIKGCTLTLEELKDIWEKQQGTCTYTKIKLVLPYRKGKHPANTASLDRIDSSKGYTANNVQFVCMVINKLKGTMSDEETKTFIQQIKDA